MKGQEEMNEPVTLEMLNSNGGQYNRCKGQRNLVSHSNFKFEFLVFV